MLLDLKRSQGRLFILGIGGSSGNASHAVNDFRKICNIEAYAPTDNVSELTAWTNDDSFNVIFKNWLSTSKLSDKDVRLIKETYHIAKKSKDFKTMTELRNRVEKVLEIKSDLYDQQFLDTILKDYNYYTQK